MPSLGIAPLPGDCIDARTASTQDVAPVSCVFPADVCFSSSGDSAIRQSSYSPYHAGPAAPRFIRLNTTAAFLACCCSLNLSDPGKPSGPGTSLRVPPGCAGDTTRRPVAHDEHTPSTLDPRGPYGDYRWLSDTRRWRSRCRRRKTDLRILLFPASRRATSVNSSTALSTCLV